MSRFSFPMILIVISLSIPKWAQSQVIVSIPPQKHFIEQIAGDQVQAEVMLTPGESPETFSPSPRQLTRLAKARVYIHIGVPFERHWTKSLQAMNPDMKIIHCCNQFDEVTKRLHQGDVHYWTDPVFVIQYLETILNVLIELQPENQDLFQSNLQAYQESLRQLDNYIIGQLKNLKMDHFIISHAALDAFAQRYGLVQLSIEQSGRESGPKNLISIMTSAKAKGIKTIFDLEQHHTRTVINLANQLGANIVSLDPLAQDYFTNMYEMTEQLLVALGKNE